MYIVMGNGESRLAVDYTLLEPHVTYGCNALFRDWSPTALVAIDEHMYHEVISSGYSKNNKCYFSEYNVLPAEAYDMMKLSVPSNAEIVENEPTGYMFSLLGRERRFNFDDAEETMKNVEKPIYYCSWITEGDKAENIDDVIGVILQDSGQQALEICCTIENPDKVYLLGFDLSINTGKVNNIYKNTSGYAPDYAQAVESSGWEADLNRIFDKYNETEFIHVQDKKILDIETISVKEFINMSKDY